MKNTGKITTMIGEEYREEAGIYAFTNLINGKIYVGESLNIKKRLAYYKYPRKRSRAFESALLKYGEEGFSVEVFYYYQASKKELLDLEELFIVVKGSLVGGWGYNMCHRGQDCSQRVVSEKTKAKISNAKKTINLSKETRHKLSLARKGVKCSIATKRKMLKAIKKPILQYSKDGNIIALFSCSKFASKKTNVSPSSISACCVGKSKSAGGFVWKHIA